MHNSQGHVRWSPIDIALFLSQENYFIFARVPLSVSLFLSLECKRREGKPCKFTRPSTNAFSQPAYIYKFIYVYLLLEVVEDCVLGLHSLHEIFSKRISVCQSLGLFLKVTDVDSALFQLLNLTHNLLLLLKRKATVRLLVLELFDLFIDLRFFLKGRAGGGKENLCQTWLLSLSVYRLFLKKTVERPARGLQMTFST